MNNYNVHVCLSIISEIDLTQRTIESIYNCFAEYQSVHIYLYDGLPYNENKWKTIETLMRLNKISEYNMITIDSASKCSIQEYIFKKFVSSMRDKEKINIKKGIGIDDKNLYLITDNNVIYNNEFGNYVESTLDKIDPMINKIKMIVKFPGGIPKETWKTMKLQTTTNHHNNVDFKIAYATNGGSVSSCILTTEMLNTINIGIDDIIDTFEVQVDVDKHVSSINQSDDLSYIIGIVPPEPNVNPLSIRISEQIDVQNKNHMEIFMENKRYRDW